MTGYPLPKKSLGQHFLKDHNIARKIAGSLQAVATCQVLEIGPGMGILTRYLLERTDIRLKVIEIDAGLAAYLRMHFPELAGKVSEGDVLSADLPALFDGPFAIIGNFPYNISSRIFFRILEFRDLVPEVVCMIQKEVAERIYSPPGSKTYGILSVLVQTYYRVEWLFPVSEKVFMPPPKVKSAVIRLVRLERRKPDCDEGLLFKVVKTAFNQRRKVLRNALGALEISADKIFQAGMEPLRHNSDDDGSPTAGKMKKGKHPLSGPTVTIPLESLPFSGKRAEELTTSDFEVLTRSVESFITLHHGCKH